MDDWQEITGWAPPPGGPYADEHVLVAMHFDQLEEPPFPPKELFGEGDKADFILSLERWVWLNRLPFRPKDTEIGRAVLEADLPRRRGMATAATLLWLDATRAEGDNFVRRVLELFAEGVERSEGFSHGAADAVRLIEAYGVDDRGLDVEQRVLKLLDRVAPEESRDPHLLAVLGRLIRSLDRRSLIASALLTRVWSLQDRPLRVAPDSPWAERILGDDDLADSAERTWLRDLVDHAAALKQTPSRQWRSTTAGLLGQAPAPFPERFARWVRRREPCTSYVLSQRDVDWRNRFVLRGLIWVAALSDSPPLDALEEVAIGCYRLGHPDLGSESVYRDPGVGNEVFRAFAELGEVGRLRRLHGVVEEKQGRAFLERLIARSTTTDHAMQDPAELRLPGRRG